LDAPISHVIGTIALIMLTTSVAAYFAITVYHVQSDILRQQLTEVSSYISTNIMEIITLTNFQNFAGNDTMFKILKIPPDVSGYVYAIELINESGEEILVRSYLLSRQDITVSIKLPLGEDANIEILTIDDGKIILYAGESSRIESTGRVYSGWDGIVVWSWSGSQPIQAGIGILKGG